MTWVIEQLIIIKLWVGAASIGGLFALENIVPSIAYSAKARFHRWRRNLSIWIINLSISLLVIVPFSAAASSIDLWNRPIWAQTGWALLADLLILDLWIYWWHRANHELPFLWRFHVVHHWDRALDTTSALRFHFGEICMSALVRAGVIIICDIPLHSILIFETIVLSCSVFHHSNIKLNTKFEKLVSLIIVTPSIHWVHHHNIRDDTDSNYATILSIWDKIFKSRSNTQRWVDMPIGVEGTKHDKSLWKLLIAPFIRQKS